MFGMTFFGFPAGTMQTYRLCITVYFLENGTGFVRNAFPVMWR